MFVNTGTGATPNGEFAEANPANGTPRSILGSAWLNMIQRECISLATAAGANLNALSFTQMRDAVVTLIQNLRNQVGRDVYPIGCVFTTTDSAFNPATAFGGAWEIFATGRSLIGVDPNRPEINTVGGTTGNYEVTVQTTLPATGWVRNPASGQLPSPSSSGTLVIGSGNAENNEQLESLNHTQSRSVSSSATNVLPPVIVVRFWRRFA